MPSATNFSGCSMGSSTTSRILSICSLHPPMSLRQERGDREEVCECMCIVNLLLHPPVSLRQG